jgi:hypothetical protein
MSKNNSVISNDNSDLDAVIREVKEELKIIFFRRKDLITKLGEAFKHTVSDEESICEEIKNALRDEIRDGHISERDIERYCPDEWKQKTKPKKPKNDKLSFLRYEQEAIPQMLVGANGNSPIEPVEIPVSDSNNNNVANNAQKSRLAIGHFNGGQELPTWNVSNPMAPGPGLHSSVSDMLKFLSANMGLVKTKLGDAMQEAHLIRHSTNQLLPNNEPASFHTDSFNTDKLGFYVGLGWMIATNFGQEIVWHSGSTPDGYNAFMVFNPTKQKGIVILCSADTSNINISDIIFKQNNNLSSVIGNLLNE